MNHLDPYDTDAGADRIERILTGQADLSGARRTLVGSVITAELRVTSGVARRPDAAEQASLYRAWTSEIMISLTDPRVQHIAIHSDRVTAVYATPADPDVTAVFYRAARANTLTWLINDALVRRGRDRIEVGLGLDYGQLIIINTDHGPAAKNPICIGEPITRAEQLAAKPASSARLRSGTAPTSSPTSTSASWAY